MTRREGSLRPGEGDLGGIRTGGAVADRLGGVPVARFGEEVAGFRDGPVDEAQAVEFDFGGVEAGGIGIFEGDDQLVALHIEADHHVELVVRVGGHADSAALPHGVAVQAPVPAEDPALGVDDVSGAVLDVVFEESVDVHVAEEADALAVFLGGVGQAVPPGQFAHLGFFEFADGEERPADLFLPDHGQEIGLVLVPVHAFQQVLAAIRIRCFAHVVPGGDAVEALGQGVLLENAELHLAVAHDVGVRGDPVLIALDEVVDDLFAVFVDQIDDLVVDPQVCGDRARILDVLLGGAVGQRHFLVHPGADVGAGHVVAPLFQAKSRHGAVHAAGEGHQNFPHRPIKARSPAGVNPPGGSNLERVPLAVQL